MRLLTVILTIAIIDIGCFFYYGCPFSDNTTIYNDSFRNSVAMAVCHLCLGIITASWICAAPRVTKWQNEIGELLYSITGEQAWKNKEDDKTKAKKLYESHLRLANTYPRKGDNIFAGVIKAIYITLWFVMIIILSALLLPIRLGHICLCTLQGIITCAASCICMELCMHSWWYSMEYGYFLSKVAKCASIEDINREHPSQTYALRRMLHASTMLSMAFLSTSILIVIQYTIVVFLDNYVYSEQHLFLQISWMLLMVVPSLVSLIPVVVLPKLFILKIHRTWKMQLIKEYEDELLKTRNKKNEIFDSINIIDSDKVDFHYFEVIGAGITVILHFGMLLATIMLS